MSRTNKTNIHPEPLRPIIVGLSGSVQSTKNYDFPEIQVVSHCMFLYFC